jgi:hypothetical protein
LFSTAQVCTRHSLQHTQIIDSKGSSYIYKQHQVIEIHQLDDDVLEEEPPTDEQQPR